MMWNKNHPGKTPSPADEAPMDFVQLRSANLIRVTDNLNRPLRQIADPALIQRVLEWLNARLDGWRVPREGVPVANLRLNFYHDARQLGNIGLGSRFIAAHALGGFCARASTPEERIELLRQLGLDNLV
jgi:hypothetical protein